MHLAKYNVPLYIRNKRLSKKNSWLRRKAKNFKSSDANKVLECFGDYSKIVEMISSSCFNASVKPKGKIAYFKAPKVFSILKNPEESLLAVGSLASQCSNKNKYDTVQLDFSRVEEMDLSANAILDVVVQELDTYRKIKGKRIRWEGAYPKNPHLKRFIQAIGVIKFLDVKHEQVKHFESKRLRVFEKRSKNYLRDARPQARSFMNFATAAFADHLDSCLKEINKKLGQRSKRDFCKYVGEILDNAEQHSGMNDWMIQGYLDTHNKDLICEIVIFNFGKSISDKFKELTNKDYTYGKVAPYIIRHNHWLYSGEMNRNDLYTLIALQQSVSTKNYDRNSRRGNGTYDLIRFFDQMYAACVKGFDVAPSTKPIMKLVSGSSQIIFDGTYRMETNPSTNLGEIAFNSGNDLTKRPDPTYVNGFKEVTFPGTCLSIKFPLPSKANLLVSES